MYPNYSLPTIGGIYATSDHQRFLLETGHEHFDEVFPETIRDTTRTLYETGIDALAAILKECSGASTSVKLWTAVNFCRESLDRLSLKLDGRVQFHFYQSLDELTSLEPSDVLLYLHFNKYELSAVQVIHEIQRTTRALVIEDFVQAPLDLSRFSGDYALNSLRKFSSLDVAVAYHRTTVETTARPTRYRALRKEAEQVKTQFLQHPSEEREQQFLRLGREADEALAVREIASAQPDELERARCFDFRSVRHLRTSNQDFLAERFRTEFPELTQLPGEYMYFMIDTPHRERYRKHLFSKRIFPVIHWADSGSELSKTILSFHIDQRYTPAELERVVVEMAEVRRTLHGA